MVNKYSYRKFDDVVFMADGPHPNDFNLDKYNEIINRVVSDSDASGNISWIKDVTMPEVVSYKDKFYTDAHKYYSQGQMYKKYEAIGYLGTALSVIAELNGKIDKLKAQDKWFRNPRNPVNLGGGASASFTPSSPSLSVDLSSGVGTGTGGGRGRNVGEPMDLGLDTGNSGTSQASLGKNIVGTVLVLGLVFAAIKMWK